MLKILLSFPILLFMSSVVSAVPLEENEDHYISVDTNRTLLAQLTSVSELSDVKTTDWAFSALQSLVERYGCIAGYPDSTYRGDKPNGIAAPRTLSRYEFAVSLNACLNKINQLIVNNNNLITSEDLTVVQRLQTDFAAELDTLRGRVDELETRTATLESDQFSTTTKLKAQIITAVSDSFGNSVGQDSDRSETYFANRGRLNFESSFTGRDLLRVRLEFGNFLDADGNSQIATATGTGMSRLNFDDDIDNDLIVSHLRYEFPVSDSLSFVVGTVGIGYTDITATVTPTQIADDGNGVPSLFGEYNSLFRRGGGGAAANWEFTDDLTLTIGYLANDPESPAQSNGLFKGGYNALAHLVYLGDQGGIGLAYSHGYSPGGEVNVTGSTGSLLAISPFGDNITTSNNIVSTQGFYQFSDKFQIHGWGGYIWANAENSNSSNIDK
jgi:hypothetical protein